MKNLSLGKIILVDDSETDVEIGLMSIRASGYNVETEWVRNGFEALDYLRVVKKQQTAIHLMILDLKMPLMNGWELLVKMRDEDLVSFPIVVMSASELPKDRERAFQLGADEFSVKPYDLKSNYHMFAHLIQKWMINFDGGLRKSG